MRIIFIFFLCLAALPLGCAGDEDRDPPAVVATTGVAAELAETVAGPGLEVSQLIPDAASPHDFQLSAQDRQALEEAELIVAIGAGLEAGVPLAAVDTPTWELTAHVGGLRRFGDAGAHGAHGAEGEEGGAEGHEAVDPHVWMDPTRTAAALPSLATALAEVKPGSDERFRRRALAHAAELRRLDRELRATLERVPPGDRELVTSHHSLGYLAGRYDLEVVAAAFPSSGAEAEASASHLDEVLDAIREHGVRAVFAQRGDDPGTLRAIADEAGVRIEDDLVIESPGLAGGYPEMLRQDAELIARALAG